MVTFVYSEKSKPQSVIEFERTLETRTPTTELTMSADKKTLDGVLSDGRIIQVFMVDDVVNVVHVKSSMIRQMNRRSWAVFICEPGAEEGHQMNGFKTHKSALNFGELWAAENPR